MDGIVKTRCLMDRDMDFKAKDEDYYKLKEVWCKIIRSWLNLEDLRSKDPRDKIYFMPEDAQYIFKKIEEKKKPMTVFDMKDLFAGNVARGDFTVYRYNEMVGVLNDQKILRQTSDGTYVPYWWGDNDESK